MRTTTNKKLRFSYRGKAYSLIVNSITYTETLIVSKLIFGKTRFWLIFQNGIWRFIGDMPLCRPLKEILLLKVAAIHGISKRTVCSGQKTLRSGILHNALLKILAINKDLT